MNPPYGPAGMRVPPWEIGRPQHEIAELAAAGQIKGPVLDIGCGSGHNAIHLSSLGYAVVGVDASHAAIQKAQAHAGEAHVDPTFFVCDALELEGLGQSFQTAIESGMFQTIPEDAKPRFAKALHAVLRAGATYYQLVISDMESAPLPRNKVRKSQIESTFSEGWKINFIHEAMFETNLHPGGARAWLSSITRL